LFSFSLYLRLSFSPSRFFFFIVEISIRKKNNTFSLFLSLEEKTTKRKL